jgi:hypothetical protein
MADYDRLNFREDWTEKVSQYLEEHPEAIGHSEEEILEKLEEMVDED